MLIFLKAIHTVIWAIMATANFVAFYRAYLGKFDAWFWIAFLLIATESMVILMNNWRCPITPVAERYTNDRRANFDIYLPEWLAKYNVRIFTILMIIEALVVVMRRVYFS